MKKQCKRAVCFVIALAMLCVMFSGCANKGGEEASEHESEYLFETLKVSCSSDGGSFDPSSHGSWGNISIRSLTYERLFQIDDDGNIRLQLLKSMEKIDDLNYKLTFWDCIYDSDGNQFTADDFIWSIQQFCDMGARGAISKMDHIEKIDEFSAMWVCNEPFIVGELETQMMQPPMYVQKTYEDHGCDFSTNPVGTGPYILESYTAGSEVVFVANENYWMKNINDEQWLATNKWYTNEQCAYRIECQIIQDASSRAIALQLGNIDVADAMDQSDVEAIVDGVDFSAIEMPANSPIMYIYNCDETSPCADINLRMAICYALDNAGIAAGLNVPASEVFGIQPLMIDSPNEWMEGREYYSYNEEKAKEYLEKSGYDGDTITILYSSNAGDATDGAAVLMQSYMNAIGINVKLYPADVSVLSELEYDPEAWDVRIVSAGFGSYLGSCLATFYSGDIHNAPDHMIGKNKMMVVDEYLDELYLTLKVDNSEENIAAWDEHFTFENCYGYAICKYSTQSACRNGISVPLGENNSMIVNACDYSE